MRTKRITPFAALMATGIIGLVKLTGCGSGEEGPGDVQIDPVPPGGDLTIAPGPSRGSAIAVSPDDTIVVTANREVGTVTVFKASYPEDGSPAKLEKTAEVPVGGEPWQVAISPKSDAAYVVLRKDQKLARITGLKDTPKVEGIATVGSEPTAVALTPGGTRAWVANWVDGTLTGVDTAKMEAVSTIDLNAALVASGLVGDVAARPALAHPRSLAITNNGDKEESDESIYVTEYFAQRIAPEAPGGANADVAKAGLLYKVKLLDKSVSTIRLAPLADMGFKDSNGGTAGCYPNQLQSITIQDKFAYVTSICASPKGPVGAVTPPAPAPPNLANIKTTTHGLVSVVDLTSDTEAPASTASMHARFDKLFTDRAVNDDGARRYPAVPVDVAFVKGGGVSYVVSNAADSLFRVRYDFASGSAISEIGAPNQTHIDLNPTGISAEKAGQNPIGMATPNIEAHKRFGFVANDVTRNVTIVDFNTQSVAGGAANAVVERSTGMPSPGSREDKIRKGRRFFNTATGRWSLKGQGWNGCQSCHMDGLTDNVTWFFARGPRQSTSLDGSFSKKDANDQRIFNWTAIVDEVADFEGNTRGISGGVGAVVHTKSAPPNVADRIDLATAGHGGLAGSADKAADPANPTGLAQPSVLADWEEIKLYMQTIRPPRKPSNLDDAKVKAGRNIFIADGSCQGCHGGDKWTISTRFYDPSINVGNALNAVTWTPTNGFPAAITPAIDPGSRFMRFPDGNAAALDQIQCIIRPVGTFGVGDQLTGQLAELRQDMTTAAQGNRPNGNGFNPPSLFGVQVGAPYLHAGGAATLESLFSNSFAQHYQAIAPNLFSESDPQERAKRVSELVHFLLSIDADTATTTIPAVGAQGGNFCATQ